MSGSGNTITTERPDLDSLDHAQEASGKLPRQCSSCSYDKTSVPLMSDPGNTITTESSALDSLIHAPEATRYSAEQHTSAID